MKAIKNTWSYIFLLGPILIIMGLSAGFVSATWEPVPLALIISGLVIVALWLLYLSYSREKKSEKLGVGRASEAGTNAIVATLSFLLIVGLINFLGVRYEFRLDLTEGQRFTLSPETQEILANLEEPVKVLLFEAGENPLNKQLLENYQREGEGKFSFEFVNPYDRPGMALEYGVKQVGEIYVVVGDRRDVIVTQQFQVLTEPRLTNSIQKLLTETPAKVYFLQGHGERTLEDGERGLAEAVSALEDKNYIVETLNLAETTGVPEDANAIVIVGPEREFLEAEVEALKDYLDLGGSLLLAIDYQSDPGLDSLLEEWGVLLDTRLAIDDPEIGRLVGLDPWVSLVTNYGDHPITANFANGVSLYPFARPVESEATPGITESPLIWTNERSWAEADVRGQLEFNPDRDRSGPLSLGVALTRSLGEAEPEAAETEEETLTPIPPLPGQPPSEPTLPPTATDSEEETEKLAATPEPIPPLPGQPPSEPTDIASGAVAESGEESRLVVLGTSQFATNGWFQQSLNGDVFLNSLSWLSQGEEEILSIRPKPITNRRLAMTLPEARLLLVTALILPLLGFSLGGILWWTRR
ncbi:MAG: Gldg family protein [Cyanobacteriota bacterium]|nr:Gldg family protein [Cyanobacteriota bacterium]